MLDNTHTHTHTQAPAFLSTVHHAHRKLKHADESHIFLSWPKKNTPTSHWGSAIALRPGHSDRAVQACGLQNTSLFQPRQRFMTHEDMHLLDSWEREWMRGWWEGECQTLSACMSRLSSNTDKSRLIYFIKWLSFVWPKTCFVYCWLERF